MLHGANLWSQKILLILAGWITLFLISMSPFLLYFICKHTCGVWCVHVCCIWVHKIWRPEQDPRYLPLSLTALLTWTRSSLLSASPANHPALRICLSPSQMLGLQACTAMTGFLRGWLGSELRFSYLQGKCSYSWVISLTPFFPIFVIFIAEKNRTIHWKPM